MYRLNRQREEKCQARNNGGSNLQPKHGSLIIVTLMMVAIRSSKLSVVKKSHMAPHRRRRYSS
jgi:hypothetical protein